jgi:mRNA interferase HicA
MTRESTVKTAELKRELAALGAVFKAGKRHTKVWLGQRQSTIPRHNEIPNQLAYAIRRQLGIG